MQELIIKTEDDVKRHFDAHDEEHEKISKLYFDTPFDKRKGAEYEKLVNDYNYTNCPSGWWGLSCGKIEMYYSHEGAVLENIHFCPFCGIKFVIDEATE